MRTIGIVALGLSLLIAPLANAVPSSSDSLTFWRTLPSDDQYPFLAGAIEMLRGLGMRCPRNVPLKDVRDGLVRRLQTGQSRADDRFTWEVITVHYSLGCTLDKRVLDSLDPALRKKLPQ
jgi:hypothetical protein